MNHIWLTVGEALLFEVSEGQLVLLAKTYKQNNQTPVQVFFQPNYGLTSGIIETFTIDHHEIPLRYQRLSETPVKILQHKLYEATENDYFCQEPINCTEPLKTSWGQFQLLRLQGLLEQKNFRINSIKDYFEFDLINIQRKRVLNGEKLDQAESF